MARIPYPNRESLEAEAALALDGMKPMNIFKMMARADSLAPPLFEATTRLFQKGKLKLSPRFRQIAILTVASHGAFPYLIAHHQPISLKVGLMQAEIDGILNFKITLKGNDLSVYQFAKESTLYSDVSDDVFNGLPSFLGEREIVELATVTGMYNFFGRFLKSLRVDIE
jgi:alkylhydroperoxidase family enzyme